MGVKYFRIVTFSLPLAASIVFWAATSALQISAETIRVFSLLFAVMLFWIGTAYGSESAKKILNETQDFLSEKILPGFMETGEHYKAISLSNPWMTEQQRIYVLFREKDKKVFSVLTGKDFVLPAHFAVDREVVVRSKGEYYISGKFIFREIPGIQQQISF